MTLEQPERSSKNVKICGYKTLLSSIDSNLEAFSSYLTHDSFGALPHQATPSTNYAIQVFLSY